MYRIHSNKLHPRFNNQKNSAFIKGLQEKNSVNLVIYTMKSRQLRFYLSKKERHWNFKNCLFYFFGIFYGFYSIFNHFILNFHFPRDPNFLRTLWWS